MVQRIPAGHINDGSVGGMLPITLEMRTGDRIAIPADAAKQVITSSNVTLLNHPRAGSRPQYIKMSEPESLCLVNDIAGEQVIRIQATMTQKPSV